MNVRPVLVPLPRASGVLAAYASVDLADAYAIDLPAGTVRDPEVLARFVFARNPRWIALLLAVRDAIVSLFGLKTSRRLRSTGPRGSRIGPFKVYASNAVEVVMGEDDRHLDFRASAFYEPGTASAAARLVLSTVVNCHNLFGRIYLAVIAPFHRLVVQSYLREAARAGWPREGAAS